MELTRVQMGETLEAVPEAPSKAYRKGQWVELLCSLCHCHVPHARVHSSLPFRAPLPPPTSMQPGTSMEVLMEAW